MKYLDGHPAVRFLIAILPSLVKLYADDSGHAKAEPLYGRSLAMPEKDPEPDNPNVGQSLNILAGLYDNLGTYVKADFLSDGMVPITSATAAVSGRSNQ